MFLTHDPVYAHELRRVWLWDEWPGRWGADAGIDLVAEDHEGHLWAIQAKAYNAAYWVTKHDVDTFLSESGRPEFLFRLLIATTDRIGRTAKRTIEAQEKQASVLLLGEDDGASREPRVRLVDARSAFTVCRRLTAIWSSRAIIGADSGHHSARRPRPAVTNRRALAAASETA